MTCLGKPASTVPHHALGTLRTLCRLLAPMLGRPADPDAPEAWEPIVALASRHSVTPSLAWALRTRRFGSAIDDYAAGVLTLNRLRNAALADALPPLLAALNGVGAAPVLLKGAAALADGLYPAPEARYLGDLDILVPRDRIAAASAALSALGYRAEPGLAPEAYVAAYDWRNGHHLPFQTHPATGVGVELHWRAFGVLNDAVLPAARCLARCETGRFRGEPFRVLHPTDRVIHAIAHSQIHHYADAFAHDDVRTLLEVARLDGRDRARIDWREVAALFEAAGHGAVLRRQAALLRDLFDWPLPVEADAAPAVPRTGGAFRATYLRHALIEIRTVAALTRRHPRRATSLWWPALATVGRHAAAVVLGRAASTRLQAARGRAPLADRDGPVPDR